MPALPLAFWLTLSHNAAIVHSGTQPMFDTATARRMMVDGQVRTADVTNLDLIAAMLAVPREMFVPPSLAAAGLSRQRYPAGRGRALLKPMVLAKLIQGASSERGRSRARCGLRHRLFVGGVVAPRRLGCRARGRCNLGAAAPKSRWRRALAPPNVTVVIGPLTQAGRRRRLTISFCSMAPPKSSQRSSAGS